MPETTETTETTTETTESTYTPPATQADLDRIIAERVNRTKSQFKDYGDLKAKAEQFDQLHEAQKTEAQKAADALAAAEKKANDATAALRSKTAENTLLNAASGKFRVPADAVVHLAGRLEFDDEGNVDPNAVTALVDEFLAERADLAASQSVVPRPNLAQGTSGKPVTQDPRAEFGALFHQALK